jgi:hypothetical protein
MPIYSPTGYLDITNATLRTSNIETSNIKIGSANLFITTGNVSDEVFQFTNATTGFVTTGNVEIGGSIIAPDGVTDIKSNLIVEGNVEAAALRLNSVSISPVYTIASGSGAIDFQASPTSLTASANIEVTGNVIAHQFHGDGSGLTGIPPTAITGTLSQWSNVTVDEVYFDGNVGIANTNPGHDLSVGSNLFVDDDGSNVLVVDGNVSATYFEGDGSRLTGLVTTLESVANIGNSTTNVIQFTNETTGFVTDANAVIGSNLTISGLTAQKVPYVDAQKVLRDSYITTSTGLTSIDSNLSVTGNMFVYGERFFIESESQLLKDPIIGLAKDNNVDQNIDIGILMQRPTSNVGIIHHGGTNELTLGYTTSNLTATEIINDLSQELTVNVIGNVVTQNNLSVGGSLKINTISAASSHSLAAVSNMGNTTSNVIQFTNPTTSLVASGNVEVDGNVVAGYLYGDGSNISGISSNLDQIVNIGNVTSNTVQFSNAITSLTATSNIEVAGFVGTSGTGAITVPVGTTAQQPTGVAGMIRFNSTTNRLEVYNGTAWQSIGGVSATGGTVTGTVTASGAYKIHTFTSSGTFTVLSGGEVDYLVVAGGGGGGSGGGGAGGMLTGTIPSLPPNTYTITVGDGGGGGRGGNPSATPTPSNGNDSSIVQDTSPPTSLVVASGGGKGGGGATVGRVGSNGGSGGGHGYDVYTATKTTGSSGQGNGGGRASGGGLAGSGGGGGAGVAGHDGGGSVGGYPIYGGNGGDGLPSSISGTSTYYAGGGGGGLNQNNNITYTRPTGQTYGGFGGLGGGGTGTTKGWTSLNIGEGPSGVSPTAGTPNTGGGGGGTDPELDNGAAGGSGIVIIRYLA